MVAHPRVHLAQDVAVNSIYAAGWEVLGALAGEIGDNATAARCQAEGAATSAAVHAKLWSEEHGGYRTVYKVSSGPRSTAATAPFTR